MKNIIFIFITAASIASCSTRENQDKIELTKIYFDLNNHEDSIAFSLWKNEHLNIDSTSKVKTLRINDTTSISNLFHSDNDFDVYGFCNGEFGGALFFSDKHDTNFVYYLDCTCPVMVDKIAENYYITQTLAHMEGRGRILKLNSPKNLTRLRKDSLATNWKSARFANLTRQEISKKINERCEEIADSIGLTFSIFFRRHNENLLIYSDYKKTYLGKIINNSIITIDTILDQPTWRYNDTPNEISNQFYHYNFKRTGGYNDDMIISTFNNNGDIYYRNDTIILAHRFKEKTVNRKHNK